MGEFFVSRKNRTILKALKKLGLILKEGARHTKAEGKNGFKATIPRHGEIKKEIVEGICKLLIKKGYDKKELKKLLKIK